MAKGFITNTILQNIANAIRTKLGVQTKYTPSQMSTAINNIPMNCTLQTKNVNIIKNGTTSIVPDSGYDGMGEVVVNKTEAEPKDVNFYDYDGTRLYSYTKSEFLNLTAFPANPSHSNLTAQGWNWALSDAKTYVTTYGELDIGQTYITSDNKTRIYITLDNDHLQPYLGIGISGTATIDWGDGNTQTVTKNSQTIYFFSHTYQSSGNYVITVSCTGDLYLGGKNGSYLLREGDDSQTAAPSAKSLVYLKSIKKIELGNNITLKANALSNCRSLESIVFSKNLTGLNADSILSSCSALKSVILPNNVTSLYRTFSQCCSLEIISLPSTITSIGHTVFSSCYSLKKITLPPDLTEIGANALDYARNVQNIKFPGSITSIGGGAFAYCVLEYMDFSHNTQVPTLSGTLTYSGSISSGFKIKVPSSLETQWKAANNWSNYAQYIVGV